LLEHARLADPELTVWSLYIIDTLLTLESTPNCIEPTQTTPTELTQMIEGNGGIDIIEHLQ
jgi:hypothetical protein